MNRPFAFFFHYNKPLSKQAGKPVISLHYKGQCHFVENLTCSVATRGRVRKQQPQFVIAGKAKSITIQKGVALIS